MTQAEHIRQMTDDQLKGFLLGLVSCNSCPVNAAGKCDSTPSFRCMEKMQKWLESPSTRDGGK